MCTLSDGGSVRMFCVIVQKYVKITLQHYAKYMTKAVLLVKWLKSYFIELKSNQRRTHSGHSRGVQYMYSNIIITQSHCLISQLNRVFTNFIILLCDNNNTT